MLAATPHIDGGQLAICALALHRDMRFKPCQRRTRAQAEPGDRCALGQRHTSSRKMGHIRAFGLNLHLFQTGTGTDVVANQRRSQPDR